MPGKHSEREKRQAEHIKQSYIKRGYSEEEAERLAWQTVNSQKDSISDLRRGGKGGQH